MNEKTYFRTVCGVSLAICAAFALVACEMDENETNQTAPVSEAVEKNAVEIQEAPEEMDQEEKEIEDMSSYEVTEAEIAAAKAECFIPIAPGSEKDEYVMAAEKACMIDVDLRVSEGLPPSPYQIPKP